MTARGPLDMWLYGTRVGTIADHAGEIRLRWSQEACERWGDGSRVVSHLLPLERPPRQPHHRRVRAFLSGLLPEGNLRERYAFAAGTTSDDVFGMIRAYGKETAGALIFVDEGAAEPKNIGSTEPVNDVQIGVMLAEAAGEDQGISGFPGDRLQSVSLAGMQPKIVLARTAEGWARCLDGYPSTHIAKLAHPADSYARDVVHSEVACLDLARALGLTTVTAELADFDGHLAIVVSRYDRRIGTDGRTHRIHQEDGAQALGINTDDPIRKFQYSRDSPSLRKLADVLRAGGSEPDRLLALTTFNLAIGNTDAHAKNISFIRDADGAATLAPAYDVAMHLHHAPARRTFAMNVSSKFSIDGITADDLLAEAVAWPLPRRRASLTVAGTLRNLHDELAALRRGRYPGVPAEAFDFVQERTDRLISQLP